MRYKKILSFLLVVVVVASLWFISKYKDIYREEIIFDISFINIPNSLILLENSKEIQIPLEIQASGLTLIWEKIFGHSLELDLEKNTYLRNDSLFFNSTKSLKNMRKIKSRSYDIVGVDDQELFLNFRKYATKKIPLKNSLTAEYTNNYYPLSDPFFNIDSVIITGNDAKVKELVVFDVKKKSKVIIKDSVTKFSIKLKEIDPELNYNPEEIELTYKATQVTEGTYNIKLKLINNSNDYEIKIIPDTIEVIFSSPVAKFETIDKEDFDIFINYDKVDDLNMSVIPEIRVKNSDVISYRISPSQVQILTIK